jgi:DNA-directed RNA polymerase specialized sigma24 family protein
MNPDEERDWVARGADDPAAFTRLYDHYFPRLYAYARYHVDTEHEAHEVVVETFLKVVEALGRFQARHGRWMTLMLWFIMVSPGSRASR